MAEIRCLFCDERGKRSKEHVWPVWLQERMGTTEDLFSGTHHAISGGVISRRRQASMSILAGRVCEGCNTGWMANLEGDAGSVWQRLLDERDQLTLSTDEISTLGMWTFKTAILVNWATNYRKLVPPRHYRDLYRTRTVPSGVFIDLAVTPSLEGLSWMQSQTLSAVMLKGDEEKFSQIRPWVYNITLGIGPIMIRTVHCPVAGYGVLPSGTNPNAVRRLFPGVPSPIRLDVERAFESLQDFEMNAHAQPTLQV